MRLFLALNPPSIFRDSVWAATSAVRERAPDIAWIPETKIHLTLKFLGEQPETALAPLAESMRAIGQSHSAPVVRVGGLGAFPNFRRPNVVWIGVDPEPRLELLHHDIEVACHALGYEMEGRAFRPHVTLGRVTKRGTADETRALRAEARKVRFTDEFLTRSIDVMQSLNGTYTTLASAPLRGI